MNKTAQFLSTILSDRAIDEQDVAAIRRWLHEDGQLNLDDVKLLVELYCEARRYCPAFEDLFFEVLEKVMLANGEVGLSEQFYLLKMLYSDRKVRDREKEFLLALKRQVKRTTPEFEALCREALEARTTDWEVGGLPGTCSSPDATMPHADLPA